MAFSQEYASSGLSAYSAGRLTSLLGALLELLPRSGRPGAVNASTKEEH